jgi:hypothetical protein
MSISISNIISCENICNSIATWGIFTKKQQGHIDLEDNFYVKTQDDTAVHLYKGDNAPVTVLISLISSISFD